MFLCAGNNAQLCVVCVYQTYSNPSPKAVIRLYPDLPTPELFGFMYPLLLTRTHIKKTGSFPRQEIHTYCGKRCKRI
jgi:hypothetical protein